MLVILFIPLPRSMVPIADVSYPVYSSTSFNGAHSRFRLSCFPLALKDFFVEMIWLLNSLVLNMCLVKFIPETRRPH